MATLEELLALLPDNDTGAIDAEDLRTIVTELFNQSVNLQYMLSNKLDKYADPIVIGTQGVSASHAGSIAIGNAAHSEAFSSVAMGQGANIEEGADTAVVLGQGAHASPAGSYGTAVGSNSRVFADSAVALGTSAQAMGVRSVAVGAWANASHDHSVAIGDDSDSQGPNEGVIKADKFRIMPRSGGATSFILYKADGNPVEISVDVDGKLTVDGVPLVTETTP